MSEKREGPLRKAGAKMEIVLKADSAGSVEAVTAAISEIVVPQVEVSIIHSAVGAVSKSDAFLAETASRLIVGFQVYVLPGMDKLLREHRVEVRLFEVIYTLVADIRGIAESLIPPSSQEQIIGSAAVIALFKSSRKGIIAGCEIKDGFLAVGQHFRIISAMGPVYSGLVESLHIGPDAVQKATSGQKVGIKIRGFNKIKAGDLVESFRPLPPSVRPWEPKGQVIRR